MEKPDIMLTAKSSLMEKRIRVLTARPSLDGHWRGLAVVSAALRDAGMEVIYAGTALNADQITRVAIEEDVDVIGLSMYGRFSVAYEIAKQLRKRGEDRPLLLVGGTVPPNEIGSLKAAGVDEVFVAGSSLDSIVDFIRERFLARTTTEADLQGSQPARNRL